MGIQTLPEYLKIIKECEIVSKHIAWEWQGHKLKYWLLPDTLPCEETNQKTPSKIVALRSELQIFSHKFDLSIKDVNNRLKDALYRLDMMDQRLRKHERNFERSVQLQGQRMLQEHQDTMIGITANSLQDQRNEIAVVSKELMKVFTSETKAVITTLEEELKRKTQTFCQQLDTMSASSVAAFQEQISAKSTLLINDINTVANDNIAKLQAPMGDKSPGVQIAQVADDKGSDTTASLLKQPKATTATQATTYVNPLFPNVDTKAFREFTPRNPYLENQANEGHNFPEPTLNIRDPTASPQRPSGYNSTTAGLSEA